MQTNIVADTSAWNQLWAMEPQALKKMLSAGTAQPKPSTKTPYSVTNGVAIIPLVGAICKYPSLFGGVSTMDIQSQLDKALYDDEVSSITLFIDSPGGTVNGTGDLADYIRTVKALKPINAFVSDNCMSAAYWIASSCTNITANQGAFIGSIGCYSVLTDISNATTAAGVQVHLVSAGEYKGLFEPGLVVDEKALAEVQRGVDAAYDLFTNSVASGRMLPVSTVKQLADGRTHVASEAKSLGLIDAIGSLQTSLKGESTMSDNKASKVAADTATPTDTVSDGEKQILTAISALSDKLDSLVTQLTSGDDDGEDDSSDGGVADDDGGDDMDASSKAVASERARLKAISEAVNGHSDLAIKSFLAGKSPTEAKAELADLLGTENATLKQKIAKSGKGIEPLALGGPSAESKKAVDANDPETIWANNLNDVQKAYSGKKEYFLKAWKYDNEKKLTLSGTGAINV